MQPASYPSGFNVIPDAPITPVGGGSIATVLTIAETPFAAMLSWIASAVPANFKIYRSQNGDPFEEIGEVDGDVLEFTDPDTVPATELWCYKVTPANNADSNTCCASNGFLFLGVNPVYPTVVVEYGDLGFDDVFNMESVNLNGLRYVNGTAYFDQNICAELDLLSLLSVGGDFHTDSASVLTRLNAPNFATVGGNIYCDNCPMLADVSLPAMVFRNGQDVFFDGAALTAASVEHLLARAVASGVATLNMALNAGTSAGLASLNAQGQADYATLIGNGNTIAVNP